MATPCQRFIPPQAETRSYPDLAAVAYLYTATTGKNRGFPCAVAYSGRRTKSDFHVAFDTTVARDRRLANWEADLREWAKHKAAKQAYTHDLKIGDVLCAVWGYEQTNADFYEVVAVPTAKSVTIRPLAARITDDPGCGAMSGQSVPLPGQYKGDARTLRARPGGVAIDSSRGYASKWSGRPVSVSWYA